MISDPVHITMVRTMRKQHDLEWTARLGDPINMGLGILHGNYEVAVGLRSGKIGAAIVGECFMVPYKVSVALFKGR